MAKDKDITRNPAPYSPDETVYDRDAPGTPDSVGSTANRGRRAAEVNGGVIGSGAGAGGGGAPEDFDTDPQGGGGMPAPKPVEKPAPEEAADSRIHGSR